MFGPDDPTLEGRSPTSPGRDPTDPRPAAELRDAPWKATAPQMGGYSVLRLLGKGGMGIVFEAEQKSPRRRVALKIVRASRVSPELLRRFEYESQVLARLQHPGIAQVYQAGTLKDQHGRTIPYFSMELIEGESLTTYVETKGLSTRQRLELMARICDAVYHAHQKGVIHRDLKPSNILVDREGQPKILDFGVARAAGSDLQPTTLRTDVGQLVGTVQYMSPEQASGTPDDIDTRSDVYALGVILYEVVAGQLPYDVRRKMLHEAVRVIREDDPTRLSSVNRTLRGDVETIVAKAMEKDKARRYQSAEALAGDIRRYLNDEPISARPASALYRVAKFGRRNKGLAIGGLVACLALVGGMVATWLALGRALAAESDLLSQLDVAEKAREAEGRARALADEARQRADEDRRLAADEAERATRAEAEASRRAEELEMVAQFQAQVLRRFDPATAGELLSADVMSKFDQALERSGASGDAESMEAEREAFKRQWSTLNATDLARDFVVRTMLKPAARSLDRRFGDEPAVDARLRQALADRYRELGLYELAMPLQEQALATRRSLYGDDHPQTRISRRSMGDLLHDQGRLAEAAEHYQEARERRPSRQRSAIGRFLESEGRSTESEQYLREMLDRSRAAKGDEHVSTLRLLDQLGGLLHRQGREEEAEALHRQAVEVGRRTLGDMHQDLVDFVGSLGALLLDMGRHTEADPFLREALDKLRRLRGEEHPSTLIATIRLGDLLESTGGHAEAVQLLAPAEQPARVAFSTGNRWAVAALLNRLGRARAALGRFEEAESNLIEAHSVLVAIDGSGDDVTDCVQALADLYERWHVAAPGVGHDAKAAQWKALLVAGDG